MQEEPTTSISALSIVTKLNQLASLRGMRAFWAEAVAWLKELNRADAVSLIVVGAHTIRLTEGALSPEVAARLGAWEQQWERKISGRAEGAAQGLHLVLENVTPDGHRLIHVPLLAEGRSLGSLTFIFRSTRAGEGVYHPTMQTLLRTLANMAALQDTLLASQERLDQVSLFYQIGQNLASSLNLERVLRETIELTTVILDAEAATLFLLDEDREELIFAIPTGEKGEMLQEFRIPLDQGVAGWVVRTGRPALVNDVQEDPRFLRQVDSQTGFQTQNLLCVPLQYRGRITGALETVNKRAPGGFTTDDLQWLTMLATQASIAIENARLYESLRQERDKIIAVQEEVRHRLARALHDGPAQNLARVLLDLDYVRRLLEKRPEDARTALDEIEQLLRRTNRDIRHFLFELRPVILETRGLVAALEYYLQQWEESEHIPTTLDVEEFPRDLDAKASGIIFSIVQEAFNNLRKHAKAEHVWVRLQRQNSHLLVEVEDDGVGFDVSSVMKAYDERNSFGLLNMREQAELLEGALEILSPSPRLQKGTLVRIRFPYERVRQQKEKEVTPA